MEAFRQRSVVPGTGQGLFASLWSPRLQDCLKDPWYVFGHLKDHGLRNILRIAIPDMEEMPAPALCQQSDRNCW
jgi:hypothetical protein